MGRGVAADEALLTIGHDLRSPIVAAELSIRAVLARGTRSDEPAPLPPWARARLDLAAERLHRLNALLDDLIDVARPPVAPAPARSERTDLRRLVDEVVSELAPALQQTASPVVVSTDGDTSGPWPRGAVYQVIANLLGNALKYGAGRPIRVRLSRREEHVRIEVCDEGVGIAPANHRAIFEKFGRVRRTSSLVSGHGLGLWIVARAVRRLHARLTVQSTPRLGTRFVVELPVPGRARRRSHRVAAVAGGARPR